MNFNPYPFERLRNLLSDCNPQKIGINLSIGEPAFDSPINVLDSIKEHASSIRYYPTLKQSLVKAQQSFVARRFGIELGDDEIIPTFGSREVLFNFPLFLCLTRKLKSTKPIIAFPNPFYQIYEGAQIASGAETIYMPLTSKNNFKPTLSSSNLERVDIVILNSPNNPTGQILDIDELRWWVRASLTHDFIVINDECYSEIYEKSSPHSILEASLIESSGTNFKNVFAINSISKRLSAPGLRSGFIAGDMQILKPYKIFRSYVGISMPLVLQEASVVAWGQDEYANHIRNKFALNLAIAREIFHDCQIFPYTFYVWLQIDSAKAYNDYSIDEVFVRELFIHTGHLVLPGSYLGRHGAGKGFVRIALTQEEKIMREVLIQIKTFRDKFIN